MREVYAWLRVRVRANTLRFKMIIFSLFGK